MRIRTFAMPNNNLNFDIGDIIYYHIPKDKLGHVIDEGDTEVLDIRKLPNRKKREASHQILIQTNISDEPKWIGSCWCWKTYEEYDKAHVRPY